MKIQSKALTIKTEKVVAKFLRDKIFTKFKIPQEIVTNGGTQFTSIFIEADGNIQV